MATTDSEPTTDQLVKFFSNVFHGFDTNKDNAIGPQELGKVLEKLGRPQTSKELDTLINKFDKDGNGKIDWTNGEFLAVIAAIDVTDVTLIDDLVFAAGFRTFDLDTDGWISPLELHIVVHLFLPMKVVTEDKFVENVIKDMDTNKDGLIEFAEFVRHIRKTGTGDILRRIENCD